MGKIDLGTTKYVVHAKIETSGIVDKPDVVGAIFGQTEGLLGNELDLRELQKTGRMGRIEVTLNTSKGKSKGVVTIPSSLDKVETAILAAALETIDRVGPCEASMTVTSIEDVRTSKRKQVISRAKEILVTMVEEIMPDTMEITDEVKESVRLKEITSYGKEKLPAGPNVANSDAIIIVEGRADVINLLKSGIKNAVAVEGTSVPPVIASLSREKTVTAFLDGDRGGDLILRELLQIGEIDYVARAPADKEVEELTKKEIFKALRNKAPAERSHVKDRPQQKTPERTTVKPVARASTPAPRARTSAPRARTSAPRARSSAPRPRAPAPVPKTPAPAQKIDEERAEKFKKLFEDLSGSLKAYVLDKDANIIKEIAVRDLHNALKNSKEDAFAVLFDGVITQRLAEITAEKKMSYLIGAKIGNIVKKPVGLRLLTSADLGFSS